MMKEDMKKENRGMRIKRDRRKRKKQSKKSRRKLAQ